MQLIGNILIALASLVTLLPLPLLISEAKRARNDGSALWGGLFVLVPLWLLLTLALSVATARGGLEWLPVRRGSQHALVLLAGLALLATSFFAFIGRIEPGSQLPLVSRPFLAWADLVLPLVTIGFLMLTVNASLGASVPAAVYRAPFALLAGLSLVHGVALLGEWAVRSQQAQVARVQSEEARMSNFEREMLERIKTLEPEKDLAELLDRADHPNPEIHAEVLAKLGTHPNLRDGIASVLRSWRADAAFSYLAAVDLPTGERTALAPAVFDGIGQMTRVIDDEIARSTHFHTDQFDPRTWRMLTTADKFAGLGTDYVPALRELRRTLDADGAAKVKLNARSMLDAWLAKQPARP